MQCSAAGEDSLARFRFRMLFAFLGSRIEGENRSTGAFYSAGTHAKAFFAGPQCTPQYAGQSPPRMTVVTALSLMCLPSSGGPQRIITLEAPYGSAMCAHSHPLKSHFGGMASLLNDQPTTHTANNPHRQLKPHPYVGPATGRAKIWGFQALLLPLPLQPYRACSPEGLLHGGPASRGRATAGALLCPGAASDGACGRADRPRHRLHPSRGRTAAPHRAACLPLRALGPKPLVQRARPRQ